MRQKNLPVQKKLIVIMNNDNWLRTKKDKEFMPEKERKEILEALKPFDEVVITSHRPDDKDRNMCREIKKIKPDIFANGGDRKAGNISEYDLCEEIGIKMVFNVGGEKIQSSSWPTRKSSP